MNGAHGPHDKLREEVSGNAGTSAFERESMPYAYRTSEKTLMHSLY
jgi:hypothetical protein